MWLYYIQVRIPIYVRQTMRITIDLLTTKNSMVVIAIKFMKKSDLVSSIQFSNM